MCSTFKLGRSPTPVPNELSDLENESLERTSDHDARLLFLTRFIRLFAYGALSVVLVFYLTGIGLSESRIGLLLTLTLSGDTVISLILTTQADRIGRRRMLIIGSFLMAGAGLAFAFTSKFLFLVIAGTIGVVSPSGNEVGPFLSIEQAALTHVVSASKRTTAFAWYTLTGSFATAIGSLCGGLLPSLVSSGGAAIVKGYRAVVIAYAMLGIVLALAFARLSSATEVNTNRKHLSKSLSKRSRLGIAESQNIIAKLSCLFALDSFGGGFVVQSFAAYWFYLRFGVKPAALGAIFFGANLFAGVSALLASRLASRIGLVRTMVFTHLPSNILLLLVPLMPTLRLAIVVLLLRFSISQMDVPTRQSYVMAVVQPDERSAAAGITGVARTIGSSIPPMFVGLMFANMNWINAPFFIAGTLKIAYDLLLYRQFVTVRAPEEEFQ